MSQEAIPTTLSPWTPGTVDIHHIDTGCGSSTFIVGPDGTTILIDCGTVQSDEKSSKTHPYGSLRPGEQVARYAQRYSDTGATTLDYLIATHVHPDHVGDVHADKMAMDDYGGFQRTGLSDIDHLMPAALVIDRAYPNYGDLPPLPVPFTTNYLAWLDARQRAGRPVERIDVGSDSQIKLLRKTDAEAEEEHYPAFSIRVLAANGRVWTGLGQESRSHFPLDLAELPPEARPDENKCSMALLLSYGNFRYYTGGDLTCDTYDGRYPWMDIETPVARVAGPVDVAVANHHAYFDACGPGFVDHLGANAAYIIPSWHDTHPGMAQLQRLLSAWPGEKERRRVFATGMTPTSRRVNQRFLADLCSSRGHVVVRVIPGGTSYHIYVLSNDSEDNHVISHYGPYVSGV